MHKDDIKKLLNAGFIILRASDHPSPRINKLSPEQSWKCDQKFETKAARDREVKRILETEQTMIFA